MIFQSNTYASHSGGSKFFFITSIGTNEALSGCFLSISNRKYKENDIMDI